jgi:tetratricopeptide (TPR) repeat protein
LGQVYSFGKKYEIASKCYTKALELGKLINLNPSTTNSIELAFFSAEAMNNERDIDLELLLSYVSQNKIKILDRNNKRALIEILLNIDATHMDEAETWIRKAIETNKRNQMPWDLATSYAQYAEFFKKKADPSQAKEKLGKAIDLMRSIGADGWVKKYEEELAAVS